MKRLKILSVLIILSILTIIISGCSNSSTGSDEGDIIMSTTQNMTYQKSDAENANYAVSMGQYAVPKDGEEIAVLHTSLGDIYIKFFPKVAPKAVENFKTHIKDKYYDGIIFHRVIPDFMIQGGDPEGTGMGGESIWGEPFTDEFNSEYKAVRGALCMANSGANTNGSQFFIVQTAHASWLDNVHTVFGQVFCGLNIVDKIAGVQTGQNDRPVIDIVIEKAEIIKYKASDFK